MKNLPSHIGLPLKARSGHLRTAFCGLLCAAATLSLVQSARAQFTFPVYEPFSEYPEGERIRTAGSSGVFWNVGNSLSGTSSPLVTNSAALAYLGLLPEANTPARGIISATGVGRTHCATFTSQTTNVYASFLLNLQTLPSGNRPIFGLNGNNSGTPNPGSGAAVWVNSSGQLLISKNSATTPATNRTSPLILGNTYFVVLAYKFSAGPDEIDLWLNPTSLGNNANVPPPTMFSTNNADNTQIQSVCLYAPTGTPITTNLIDEIRVSTNWAEVTPNSCLPGNTYNVTGGGSGCPGNSFAVGLNGSDANVNYLLYTNGVFSEQTISGTGSAINFAPQSTTGSYVILASNTVSGCIGWMNGSATIIVLDPPNIVTQPKPAIVATNGLGAFSVTATGTGLSYRWYKNGTAVSDGDHLAGSETPNLAIFPAGTADEVTAANGYYVVISNSCGATAISTTNALTLDAPANIVWQGGNVTTNWDVATSANWTNDAGTAVVFNYGDNVTFDDTSTNLTVTLVGSVLSPSLVTVSAEGNNYSFVGSGSIVGPGRLLKTGGASLINTVANGYTGGTTISNGTIYVTAPPALKGFGANTITLAGGALRFATGLGFSGPAVGVSNNINQTANSTLQYDGTGSQGCVLLGALNGTPGTTLTITHLATTGSDRIRFYGSFTNDADILLNAGADRTLQYAPYNPSGNQVYNGVISGNGQIIERGNGGNLILNAQNTFSGGLILSAGAVGVGADSISSFPPAVDSGPVGTGPLILAIESGAAAGAGSCTLFADGGARTIHNPINYLHGTNSFTFIIGGSNNLTLAGDYSLVATTDGTITNRTITVNNTALTTLSGVISDSGLAGNLTKNGDGILTLSGVNAYTGTTLVGAGTLLVNGQIDAGGVTVTNGTLGGTGTILGPVTIQSPGNLAPGVSIGSLTINNDLTLGGNLLIEVNKSVSPSNDTVVVSGVLTNAGTGTLTVFNLGPALTVGNKFTLFNKAVQNGSALTITGGGVTWSNNLSVDGSITVASLGPVPKPVINSTALVGNSLIFSGTNGTASSPYYVLSTTNLALPLTNWTREFTNTFGAGGTFSYTNTVNFGTPAKFYLLLLP